MEVVMEELIRELLMKIGEDPDREGLERTPQRVAESLRFLTSGYREDVEDVLKGAIFEEEYDEMVIVKDISLYSLCEHHILPFFGKCHVAYIPKGKIIGISNSGAGEAYEPDSTHPHGPPRPLRGGRHY